MSEHFRLHAHDVIPRIIQVINVPEKEKKLIGAGQYHKYVSEELKIKHFKKVLEGNLQVYTFLIRNRLKIKFHSK
mgnify:CR=1 FL=1